MAKVGRPSDYTPELAREICKQIANGKSMRSVCRQDDMPGMTTVFRWLGDIEDFRKQYDRATEERAEALVEDMLDIADNEDQDTQRSRLRVDTRKWIASKLKPKKYGDKQQVEHSGEGISFHMHVPETKE